MITLPVKCMLAASTTNYTTLFDGREYLLSDKLDGVRCVSTYGEPISRTGKLMRNLYIQDLFKQLPKDIILDGELLCCDVAIGKTFSDYTKDIMSIKQKPTFKYYIFDLVDDIKTAKDRYNKLLTLSLPDWCSVVPQLIISDLFSMESLEADAIKRGAEGIMLKSVNSLYKFGRSTIKEKGLIKIKRFSDDEAIIEGFEEKYHNMNEKEEDELGFSKRSSCLAGMIGAKTLGSLRVHFKNCNTFFNIGTGFSDIQRQEIWDNRQEYIGKIVKFKHFENGSLNLPRFPVFLGFRDEIDVL